MTQQRQRQIIATAAIVVMAVGIISSIQKKKGLPGPVFFVGYGFAFALTSIMADLGFSLGAAMALVIMVGTVLENADAIVAWLGQRAKGGTTPAATPATPAGPTVQNASLVTSTPTTTRRAPIAPVQPARPTMPGDPRTSTV